MSDYQVRHLGTDEVVCRPAVHFNRVGHIAESHWRDYKVDPAIEAFHRTLPDYGETKVHNLTSVALELGVSHVFVKDESTRFGLPAFKILGASWAVHRAICQHLGISLDTSIDALRQALVNNEGRSDRQVRLVTCTEGNWGRAVARMAKYLGIRATVYVPGFMSEYTQNLVHGESAELFVLKDGSYDDCIAATKEDAEKTGALMVMDTSWDGYEEVPRWVTDGYTTMLTETDRQVAAIAKGRRPNTFFVSIGVGSWAHSVVMHYKAADPNNMIVSVEPTAAACLKESLHRGQSISVSTQHTIMAGMCCGTPSQIAYPILRDGLHAAVVVDDVESHKDVEVLQALGVSAGPCGAATLAGLRKYTEHVDAAARKNMVVVLFSTEGWRKYDVPS